MARPTPTLGNSAICASQWPDEWLLQSFEGHESATAENLRGSVESAWEALAQSGMPDDTILQRACAVSATRPAKLESLDGSVAHLLDPAVAERYGVVPVELRGAALVVACSNPLSATLEQELAFATARRVILTTQTPSAIRAARLRIYGEAAQESSSRDEQSMRLEWVTEVNKARGSDGTARTEAVVLLDQLLVRAISQRASDMHLEPGDDGLLVRLRVDGVLFDSARVRKQAAASLVNRLKVMAGLDITDRRRPQDGRALARIDGRTVDFRVSTLPLGGMQEKVMVRVLDSRDATASLTELGFSQAHISQFDSLLSGKEGLILITGPTGAGKTSTLYSLLRTLGDIGQNVVTVEDPIEHRLEGITQVQVRENEGLTFSSALQSLLRQDPDAVMIDEVRESQAAQITSKAAITGHLVFASFNSNDAPAAIRRLLDLGADSAVLARALRIVVAQRLVRRLCTSCCEPMMVEELPADQRALLEGRNTSEIRKAVGCVQCRGTGYLGRMVVPELIVITPALQRAIVTGASAAELAQLAGGAQMNQLWEVGLAMVLAGDTTLHELLDNVAAPVPGSASSQQDIDALLASMRSSSAQAASGGEPKSAAGGASGGAAETHASEFERGDARRGSRSEPVADSREATVVRGEEISPLRAATTSVSADAAGCASAESAAPAPDAGAASGTARGEKDGRGGGVPPRINDDAPHPIHSHYSDASPISSARAATNSGSSKDGFRVLIIDDDRVSRAATRSVLESAGFTVIEAADGEAGLAYARRLNPDAVLTEVALPRLDGIALIQCLTRDPIGAQILIFVHTAQTDESLLSWLSELGADGILHKSLSPEALCFALRRARVEVA